MTNWIKVKCFHKMADNSQVHKVRHQNSRVEKQLWIKLWTRENVREWNGLEAECETECALDVHFFNRIKSINNSEWCLVWAKIIPFNEWTKPNQSDWIYSVNICQHIDEANLTKINFKCTPIALNGKKKINEKMSMKILETELKLVKNK